MCMYYFYSIVNEYCCLVLYNYKGVYMFLNLYIYRMLENSRQTQNSKKLYDNISHTFLSKYPNLENKSFLSLKLIPNKLKISSWPRSMCIHKFFTSKSAVLRDFSFYHLKKKIPVRCQFHRTTTLIKISVDGKDNEIPASTYIWCTSIDQIEIFHMINIY